MPTVEYRVGPNWPSNFFFLFVFDPSSSTQVIRTAFEDAKSFVTSADSRGVASSSIHYVCLYPNQITLGITGEKGNETHSAFVLGGGVHASEIVSRTSRHKVASGRVFGGAGWYVLPVAHRTYAQYAVAHRGLCNRLHQDPLCNMLRQVPVCDVLH